MLHHATVKRSIQYNGSSVFLEVKLLTSGSISHNPRENLLFLASIGKYGDNITILDIKANSPITFLRSDAKQDILLEAMMWCLKQKYPEPNGSKTKAAVRT